MDVFELMRVGDVMECDIPAVPLETTIGELSRRIAENDSAVSRRQATLIINGEQRLAGIITRGDLVRALENSPDGRMPVLEAGKTTLVVTFPDEILHDAIAKMLKHDVGRLPVVNREEPDRVVGYLGRGDILGARARLQEEEESRSTGPVFQWRNQLETWARKLDNAKNSSAERNS